MDSRLLADAIDYLRGQRDLYNINSLTVIRHGHVVADAYFYPYQPGDLHDVASVSKVWLTTTVGIAVDQGFIPSVDEPVVGFFPDRSIANLDEWKREMTVEDLLTMTSGLGFDDAVDRAGMEASDDWTQYALDLPMTAEPGTRFNYHQVTAYLLSAIISEVTGMSAEEFARKNMFEPLGIQEAVWIANPQGVTTGHNGVHVTPYDLARFGQMILHDGSWEGKRVVSKEWVQKATSIVFGGHYGYMWIHYPGEDRFFIGSGAQGQRIVVSPPNDLVVVFTGHGYANEDVETVYLEALRTYILPAVKSALPIEPDPEGNAILAGAAERAAAVGHEPEPVDPLPPIASEISGKTYVMEVPPGSSLTFTLTFVSSNEARVLVDASDNLLAGSPFEWPAGLDGVERYAPGRYHILAAGTGGWTDDRTFVMMVDGMGDLDVFFRITLEFEGDAVTVTIEDLWWWEPNDTVVFTGRRR